MRPASQLERLLPWALGLGFLALALADCGLWHPGFSYLDEGSGTVSKIQEWHEGRALPFELFKGSLHRGLAAWLTLPFGRSLWVFRAISLGALFFECLLLWRFTAERFGQGAAAWAVAACLASAQTFLRARSLLSFTLLPLELLLLLSLMRREWSWKGSLLLGALAALTATDYEGAMLLMPVVALYWLASPRHERPRGWELFAGYALAIGLLAWASRDGLGEYFSRRLRSLPHNALNPLRLAWLFAQSFFGSADCIGYLGVKGRSFLPLWALPAFAAGLWVSLARHRLLMAWLAVGLLPAFSIAGSSEPNRILAAWPVICMLCGAGLAWLSKRTGNLLWVLVLAGGIFWEAAGYRASMSEAYPFWYGESAAIQNLAKKFEGRRLVNELGGEYSSQFRFLWPDAKAGAAELFVLPLEYAPGLGKDAARLRQDGVAYLDSPAPALAARLGAVDAELRAVRLTLPNYACRRHAEMIGAYLDSGRGDAWTRTALLEEALRWSSGIGEMDRSLLQRALHEPLVSSSSLIWLSEMATRSGDQAFARRLCARARQVDPRRPCVH